MSGSHEWAVELAAFGKSYAGGWLGPNHWAARDISLRVAPGKVLGLLGPNGSGKSTTLKALAGLVVPTQGKVAIFGAAAGSLRARAAVGYLPESVRFPVRQSGREIVRYCAGLAGMPAAQVEARTDAVLVWAGLGEAADRRVGTYSKGMRQRLGLAQAVVHDPPVVLLDEPASGLDPEGRIALVRFIRDLARQGRTVVFTSHLLAQAGQVCDHLVLLGGGRVLVEGTPGELLGPDFAADAAPSPLEKLYLEKIHGG